MLGKRGQLVWLTGEERPAKVEEVFNAKADNGKNRMLRLRVDKGAFTVPYTAFDFEIEPIGDRPTSLQGFRE